MEVGHLRKGQRPFRVKAPKIGEDHSEVLRRGVDDLTLRAEEGDTLQACINVDHIGEYFRDRHWWTQTGTSFAKQFVKELKEVRVNSCISHHYREMSKAAGSKKPNESQAAKALWAMKAAKDREEDFYDPAGRSQTRQELWREHFEDPIGAWDKALKYEENLYQS